MASVGGVHYVMIVRDDYTRYTWLPGLKSKSASATAFAFREFLADVRADVIPSSVEIVRTDNGFEFTSVEFARVCNKLMIKREFTPPYTPQWARRHFWPLWFRDQIPGDGKWTTRENCLEKLQKLALASFDCAASALC